MLAPSKRRAWFYTLPIVILIGFLIVAGLVAWQRSRVVEELAERVAHGEKSEAVTAVRHLAILPRPPLSVLVDAATADERATAEAAQVAINRLLGKWQQEIDEQRRINAVASQLTELAAALAEERRAFGPDDYPWLLSATRKIVQLSLKCPAKKTPLVALHCDEVISTIARANSPAAIAGRDEPREIVAPPVDATVPIADAPEETPQQGTLEHAFSAFSSERFLTERDGQQEPVVDAGKPIDRAGSGWRGLERNSHPGGMRDSYPGGIIGTGESLIRVPGSETFAGQSPAPVLPPPHPDWAQPLLRMLPVQPMKSMAEEMATPKLESANAGSTVAEHQQATNDTRKLLARWLASKGEETQFVAHDLATRGFKRLPRRLVEQSLSETVDDRLRLVDDVLKEPGVDARPWLILLSDDASAEVRLMVVTIMATSDDKTLVEKAWQVAIRDRDPRIADLASRLRERRGGALLR